MKICRFKNTPGKTAQAHGQIETVPDEEFYQSNPGRPANYDEQQGVRGLPGYSFWRTHRGELIAVKP